MTPIYRPPVYGPAPTVEEHRAAPGVEWCSEHVTTWLHRASDDIIRVRTLSEVGGRLLYNGAVANLYGEWCLLDPATNLPGTIGTPPETGREREQLERTLCEARRAERVADAFYGATRPRHAGDLEFANAVGAALAASEALESAARALADHILGEPAEFDLGDYRPPGPGGKPGPRIIDAHTDETEKEGSGWWLVRNPGQPWRLAHGASLGMARVNGRYGRYETWIALNHVTGAWSDVDAGVTRF